MKLIDVFLAFLKEKNWAQILILLLVVWCYVLKSDLDNAKAETQAYFEKCEKEKDKVRFFYDQRIDLKDKEIARCKQLAEDYKDSLIAKYTAKEDTWNHYLLENKRKEKSLERKINKTITQ